MRGLLTPAFLSPSIILPGIAPIYVFLCPLISASSLTPPRQILTYSLPSAFATDLAIDVLPVPGGPARHMTGAFPPPVMFLTASDSRILSLISFIP